MTTETETEYICHNTELLKNGIMLLMGPITSESLKPVIEWILYENLVRKKKRKELQLMICSEGGNLTDAFALCDVMKGSKIPISTIGLGEIASSGLMIFMAGTKGKRILTPNTSIMSHQFAWETSGKVHELFASVKEFESTHNRMINMYQKTTGLDKKTITNILLPPHDVYITAKEALKYNICDVVAEV